MKPERPSSQLHNDPLMMQLNKKINHHNHNHSHGSSSNKEKITGSTTTILPQEIIEEILYRLPVKSLLRFKCVSKRWLSVLSDSNFNLYYKRKSSSLFAITLNGKIPSLYSIDDDNASSIKAFSLNVPPMILEEHNSINHSWQRKISNACNGLVLLRISKDSLVLFNPSTRSYSLKALTLDCFDSTSTSYYTTGIGLCYDASIDDYKAIVITYPVSNAHRVVVSCLKNKRWVEITHDSLDIHQPIRGPLVNGHIHWTIGTIIAYFETTRNTFEALPSPPDHHQYLIIGLGVLDECLCIARTRRINIIENDVEVVAMKKYGVAESWTTLYVLSNLNVSSFSWCVCSLLLTKNGEEVLFMRNQQEIWAYNPTSKSHRKFDIPDEYLCATSVVQTIVSPAVVLDAEQ